MWQQEMSVTATGECRTTDSAVLMSRNMFATAISADLIEDAITTRQLRREEDR